MNLSNREAGIWNDAAECAGSELLVVRYDDPGVGLVAAEDHVAAVLAAENKSGAFKSGADFKAG